MYLNSENFAVYRFQAHFLIIYTISFLEGNQNDPKGINLSTKLFETKPSFIIGKGLVDRPIEIISEKKILLVYPFKDLSTEAVFNNNKSFVKKSDINENAISIQLNCLS